MNEKMYQNITPKPTRTFTGKERDSETGFSYFGARYYDSDLMTGWLSVDLLADKYPNISPYAYCAWNPIKLVDPNGEELAMNDDIVIKGGNNSSITVKTDLVDFTISVDQDFGGNFTLQGEEVVSATLNLVGIFDPTGVCDATNAILQAKNGECGGAIISAIGIVPYVGDIAKIGNIIKDIKIIKNAINKFKKSPQGLGNPFKDKTLKEIEGQFQDYKQKGKLKPARNSVPGNSAYVNTKSGYSYNLDPGNSKEGPHVDVNYPHKVKGPKKKLPTKGGF